MNLNPTPFPEPSDEQLNEAREKAQRLDENLMKLGLHARQMDIGVLPDGRLALIAAMSPSDRAWSDEVQNPVQHQVIEQLDDELTEARIQEMRERARRLRETGEL